MSLLLIIIHVIVCIALIMIVLLQTGKGADMGAAFGGGSSQTLFGSTGASTFLSKATTVAAIVFMLTSLTLAYVAGGKVTKSVVTDAQTPIEQPADQPPAQAPEGATDSQPKSE
ncbi:MAG: preprotein translocase subunit SecG [Desulfosarcina sp.]